ncbi:hypothetical protein DHEL01_v206089 [Diaporthe helianthi]|uniref:Uncharacterized protein n=1 Tax=Diaporthe helianthi TaxID=158607 RepID=A0A2P5HZ44_DIAHE|nr:hypothetical protein DHEL01_v206089 [Diaporthe helianthi]
MTAILAGGSWNRKAGRYDYNRFDHIASTSASVGYQSIGKVNVDVRFLFRKSQWGTLGPAENAAGIIYMELDFDQPPDCALESATIQLTLDEDDQGLDPYRLDNLPPSECPVLVTDYYGPGQIVGTSKRVLIRKSLKVEPSVNVIGNGGSLGGFTTEKAFEHESRWTFRSHRVPDDRSSGKKWGHRILRWEMTENDIEKSTHSNKVYTAFAYEHSGQPFLMKIEISGKLRKRSDRMKANLNKKFGSRARKQEDISTTLVGAYLGHRRPLDELARGLASAMELQNYMLTPLVVPSAQTASFHQVANDPSSSTTPVLDTANSQNPDQIFIAESIPQPELRLNGQAFDLLEDTPSRAVHDRTEPTLENLARVGEYFRRPIRLDSEAIRGDVSEASGHSSGTTLVANQSEQSQPIEPEPEEEEEEEATTPRSQTSVSAVTDNFDEDIISRVMEVAFLRILFQFVIGIMDLVTPRKLDRAQRERVAHKRRHGRARHNRREV